MAGLHPQGKQLKPIWELSIDQGQCLPFPLHLLDSLLYGNTTLFKFLDNFYIFCMSELFRFCGILCLILHVDLYFLSGR